MLHSRMTLSSFRQLSAVPNHAESSDTIGPSALSIGNRADDSGQDAKPGIEHADPSSIAEPHAAISTSTLPSTRT